MVRVSSRSRCVSKLNFWNICIISYRFTGKHLTLKLISVGIQENDPLYATGSSVGKDLLVPMSCNDTSEHTPVKSVLHVLCAIRGNFLQNFIEISNVFFKTTANFKVACDPGVLLTIYS